MRQWRKNYRIETLILFVNESEDLVLAKCDLRAFIHCVCNSGKNSEIPSPKQRLMTLIIFFRRLIFLVKSVWVSKCGLTYDLEIVERKSRRLEISASKKGVKTGMC